MLTFALVIYYFRLRPEFITATFSLNFHLSLFFSFIVAKDPPQSPLISFCLLVVSRFLFVFNESILKKTKNKQKKNNNKTWNSYANFSKKLVGLYFYIWYRFSSFVISCAWVCVRACVRDGCDVVFETATGVQVPSDGSGNHRLLLEIKDHWD